MQTTAVTAERKPFSPALRTAGRVLAAIAGVAAGGAMLFFGGLFALFTTCGDAAGESSCGNLAALVGPLEVVAVFGGAAACVAGGIATAKTGRARWIACGLTATIVLVWVLKALLNLQQSALS
jgi:hypothetical protein